MGNILFECSQSLYVFLWTNEEMESKKNRNATFKFQKTKKLPHADRKLILSRKYFSLWKIKIQYKKRNKSLQETEKLLEEKIISFLSHLRINTRAILSLENTFSPNDNLSANCKSNISNNMKKVACTEIYQNRFEAQKSIISNQKALIAEQKDIINKLRSSSSTADEHHFALQYKEQFKILNESAGKTKLLPKPVEHPLVKSMKEREEDRKNRWSLMALRKKEKEKYLEEMLRKEEEERKILEEKKRKLRIQEKREKERMMKEMEIKKKRDQEICAVLTTKANSLYKTLICAKTFQMWRGYLNYLQYLQSKCSHIYDMALLKHRVLTWRQQVVLKKDLLHNLAIRLDETYTIMTGWYKWKWKIHGIRRRRREITIWYDKEITRIIFKKWLCGTYKSVNNKKIILQSFENIYDRILLLKTFGLWKQLPLILYYEREKEKRLREWESRVKSILPDYNMQLL